MIQDEYDENPNDHSQAIYDQQSYHEEYVYGDEDNTFPTPEFDENGNAIEYNQPNDEYYDEEMENYPAGDEEDY